MNKHIEDYLDYYTSLEVTPSYAVMLRGKWGSGKTWFIKNYIDSKEKDLFLYVSLYGITSFSEIEDAFFQQLHPMLASKGMKLVGKIIKGLIKTTIKVDINGDGKGDGTVSPSLNDINIPSYLRNIDKKIIVFDDLERCSIPIQNILGYINQFVEYNGLKVIILANELEIIRLDEIEKTKDSTKAYLTIKEKLIGKSFDVHINFDSALDVFIKEIKKEDSKIFFTNKKILFKELFLNASYDNLRHLRQTIFDFERFYDFIPSGAKKNNELIDHIISLFFAISFEIKKGEITEDDICKLYRLENLSINKVVEKTSSQIIKEKYSVFSRYYHPINDDLLTYYFKMGTINKEELSNSIENSFYFQNKNTPNWIKLWRYYDLDDDDFNKLYSLVFFDFKNFILTDKYILVQVTCMLISFSELNLIPIKKSNIINVAKKNVDNLKKKGLLKINKNEEFSSESSYGFGYQGKNIQETIDFFKYINEKIKTSQFDDYPKIASELLFTLQDSIDKFQEKIILSQSSENLYYDVPILKFISPKQFTDAFLKLSNGDKKTLAWVFEKRYKFSEFNIRLKDELPWLKKVFKILDKEKELRKGKISGYIIESLVLKSLTKCINQLNQCILSNSSK